MHYTWVPSACHLCKFGENFWQQSCQFLSCTGRSTVKIFPQTHTSQDHCIQYAHPTLMEDFEISLTLRMLFFSQSSQKNSSMNRYPPENLPFTSNSFKKFLLFCYFPSEDLVFCPTIFRNFFFLYISSGRGGGGGGCINGMALSPEWPTHLCKRGSI